MERRIFKDSAFKHGFDQDDFNEVMRRRHLVLRNRRGFQNVYEILGRNGAGDYLHVITRRFRKGDDKFVLVFHINRMKPSDRKRFIQIIERK